MAIQQFVPINAIQLYGDGVSTSITIDISNYLRGLNVLPGIPASVLAVTGTTGFTVSSFSLSGAMLTVNFVTAPAATNFAINTQFLF
jgi:hypothetical protein